VYKKIFEPQRYTESTEKNMQKVSRRDLRNSKILRGHEITAPAPLRVATGRTPALAGGARVNRGLSILYNDTKWRGVQPSP